MAQAESKRIQSAINLVAAEFDKLLSADARLQWLTSKTLVQEQSPNLVQFATDLHALLARPLVAAIRSKVSPTHDTQEGNLDG